jgi:3-oxoacyl-[acyl-carrier protein] reductase
MSTAMVWGANGGIGRALVAQLAADGWTTFAMARHPDGLTSLTRHVIEADGSNSDAVQRAVATAKEQVTGGRPVDLGRR